MHVCPVKVAFKCPSGFKSYFKMSTCILTISVGQLNHENDRLIATIEAINKASFKRCHIMLCDSLQRHTMAIGLNKSAGELYARSIELGDDWIKKNGYIISRLAMCYTLKRWDEWLLNPDFEKYKVEMIRYHETNEGFKKAMSATIDDFIARSEKRNSFRSCLLNHIFESSFNYLIEECAVQKIWGEYPFHYEIYPSPRNDILTYCYETFIKPNNSMVLQPVALKFKRRVVSELVMSE